MGLKKYFIFRLVFYGEIAQLVERGIEDPSVEGSIPSLPTKYTGVAQFGLERPVWARKVWSSNLPRLTKLHKGIYSNIFDSKFLV